MVKCKGCGVDIPNGTEYCAECLSKLNTAKDSESYLDSLLNAVMTEEPERREIVFPRREASSLVSVPEDKETVPEESSEDFEEDWLKAFMSTSEEASEAAGEPEEEESEAEEPIEEPEAEEEALEEPEAEEEALEEPEEDEPWTEDLFGSFFEAETDLPDLQNYSIFEDVDESTVDRMLAEDLGEAVSPESEAEQEFSDKEEDASFLETFGDTSDLFETESQEEVEEDVPSSEVGDIEDLFGMLEDERGADAPEDIEMTIPEVIAPEDLDAAADTFSGIVEVPEEEAVPEFGDFADLFGGTEENNSEEAPMAEPGEEPITEFGDFADMFGGSEDVIQDEMPVASPKQSEQSMDDFADLFAGLEGGEGGLFEFGAEPVELAEEPEPEEDVMVTTVTASETSGPQVSKKPAKKKKKEKGSGESSSLFHKLFDNVKVDPSKIKQPPTKEELEAQKKAKQEAKERSKEAKEALLAEKKEQAKQEKLEKQRIKREAKAEKKAKKMEEAKLLLEEMERTRINRAGASIVFIFFAMIAVVIIVGTSIFSYSLSIKNAEYEFGNKQYTAAYNEIYGLEMKKEDVMLYDRIMTVMYVQKQLNSYENYYGMNDKPKALDSLLKGLQRYEKYIELAVKLDVDTDLDSVRNKILEKVSASFMLTEQEAMEIIQSDNRAEYSKKVYDAVERLEE